MTAPTLETLAARCLEKEIRIAKKSRVLVAVSGGPDSMALLHVLSRLRERFGFSLAAHGIDHGIRSSASAELDRAEAFARSLEVPFDRTRLRVAPGGNLQARAREARYAALRRASMGGATRGSKGGDSPPKGMIATAHHADDRAETVLIRLLRGSGPAGLAVLPPRSDDLIRPFIRARREDVELHVARHRIDVARDPSNTDPRFLRTRVRGEVLPLLRGINPQVVEHLCALADQLGALDRGEGAHIYPLPRATQNALAELARNHHRGTRILLPGGLVARTGQKRGH